MIYFDNAATSFPKAPFVAENVFNYLKTSCSNVGRASYSNAIEISRTVFQARENIRKLLNADKSDRVIFTNNATHALNMAIHGLVKENDHVVTTHFEHNSVLRPLEYLRRTRNIKVSYTAYDEDYFPELTDFENLLKQKPQVAVFTACSNVTGNIMPFKEMVDRCREYGVISILDASQLMGSYPLDLQDVKADVVCSSGHKGLLGPTGTGVMVLNSETIPEAFLTGGTGSNSESIKHPEIMPDMFEAGTPNTTGIVGLNTSLEFILDIGINVIRKHKIALIKHFIECLDNLENTIIHSCLNVQKQAGVFSLTPANMSITELIGILDEKEIASRMGLHCAPLAHKALGTFDQGGTIRVSLGFFNTFEEIDELFAVLKHYDC